MNKYYYHFTKPEKFADIMEEGLKEISFLCKSEKDCLEFVRFYMNSRNYTDIFILRIDGKDLDKEELSESYDHNRSYIDVDAFIYFDRIEPESIELHNAYKLNRGNI